MRVSPGPANRRDAPVMTGSEVRSSGSDGAGLGLCEGPVRSRVVVLMPPIVGRCAGGGARRRQPCGGGMHPATCGTRRVAICGDFPRVWGRWGLGRGQVAVTVGWGQAAVAGDIRRARGRSTPAGGVSRVRGHFLPAGDVLRVRERDCCPRRRRMPPAGTRRARPCGMSPGAGRCEAGRCRRGDVRVLRGTQGRVSRIWCQGTPPWWEADRPSSTKPRRA